LSTEKQAAQDAELEAERQRIMEDKKKRKQAKKQAQKDRKQTVTPEKPKRSTGGCIATVVWHIGYKWICCIPLFVF